VAQPLPATVEMMPVTASTLRIRALPLSAIYKLPLLSMATPFWKPNRALVAGPPSPIPVVGLLRQRPW